MELVGYLFKAALLLFLPVYVAMRVALGQREVAVEEISTKLGFGLVAIFASIVTVLCFANRYINNSELLGVYFVILIFLPLVSGGCILTKFSRKNKTSLLAGIVSVKSSIFVTYILMYAWSYFLTSLKFYSWLAELFLTTLIVFWFRKLIFSKNMAMWLLVGFDVIKTIFAPFYNRGNDFLFLNLTIFLIGVPISSLVIAFNNESVPNAQSAFKLP